MSRRVQLEALTVVRIDPHPYYSTRPMSAFLDMLPSLLKRPVRSDALHRRMTWLRRLAGSPTTDSAPDEDLANGEIAHAIARPFVDLLGAVVAEVPLLIVIDDAQ